MSSIGITLFALALVTVAAVVNHGRRRVYREPNEEKLAREAERIVYGQGVWINLKADGQIETPDEGIVRLVKVLGRNR